VRAGYNLSQAAQTDLADIYAYTRETFGAAQAERYVAGLKSALDAIGQHPLIGSEKSEFSLAVRVLPHERHIILYITEKERPLIIRIVAGRQRWQLLFHGHD